MADETEVRLPLSSDIGTFDGTGAAGRWLSRLHWAFKSNNNGTLAFPNALIQAINMGLQGPAATLVDSSDELRAVVARSDLNMATVEDWHTLETALKDNYSPTIVDPGMT